VRPSTQEGRASGGIYTVALMPALNLAHDNHHSKRSFTIAGASSQILFWIQHSRNTLCQ
jgi:hypothetical protein